MNAAFGWTAVAFMDDTDHRLRAIPAIPQSRPINRTRRVVETMDARRIKHFGIGGTRSGHVRRIPERGSIRIPTASVWRGMRNRPTGISVWVWCYRSRPRARNVAI